MKLFRICMTIAVVGIIGSFASCGSKDPDPAAVVSFTTPTYTYAEDVGTVNVSVTMSKVSTSAVTVNYVWASSDTTARLGGDFTLPAASTITIPAGATTANLSIGVIDDTLIDGDDKILFTLTTATGAALNSTANTATVTITDNDVNDPADDKLQIDLQWYLSPITADINAVTMDVILAYNLKLDTAKNTLDFDTFTDSGDQDSGFKTIFVNKLDTDQTYYVIVYYTAGSGQTNYKLVLNGWGYENSPGTGKLTAPNYLIPYGPFDKSSDTFPYTGRASSTKFKNIKVLELPMMKHNK